MARMWGSRNPMWHSSLRGLLFFYLACSVSPKCPFLMRKTHAGSWSFLQVGAIHQKRTLAFINYFVTSTVSFLNNFSRSCEVRLQKCESRIQKLEASIGILEAKVSLRRKSSLFTCVNKTFPDSVLGNKFKQFKDLFGIITSLHGLKSSFSISSLHPYLA